MEKKNVLLIGGAGTLGSYTSRELLNLGYAVDVICREDLTSWNSSLRYIRELVTDGLLLQLFQEKHYTAVVDFIHYPDPEAYRARGRLLLQNTDQLIFLSSYRVYGDAEHPVRETSPRLIDLPLDPAFLKRDTYGVPKAYNEDFLRSSGCRNWTIVRPLISFSHFRLDLVTLWAGQLILRAKEGKKTLLPEGARRLHAGVGWAGNVGKEIARLVENPAAFGEAFTLGSGESLTWEQAAAVYTEVTGLEFIWVDDETYINIMHGDGDSDIYTHDRAWDRDMDLSKIMRVTGLTPADLLPMREALIYELGVLSENPALTARFDYSSSRRRNERMDRWIAEHENGN